MGKRKQSYIRQRNNGFIGEREGNMDKIVVDFGNIIEEMKNKKIKLCRLYERTSWFIIDNQDRMYQIETYYDGGYLDKFIIEKLHIEFNLVPVSVMGNIEELEKDIWDAKEVKKFIERQSKYWQ